MTRLKPIQRYELISEIRSFFDIKPFEHIIPWAEKNINFAGDVSAERDRLDFSMFPYQIAPIKEWEDLHSIKKVTFVCVQQGREDELIHHWLTVEDDL